MSQDRAIDRRAAIVNLMRIASYAAAWKTMCLFMLCIVYAVTAKQLGLPLPPSPPQTEAVLWVVVRELAQLFLFLSVLEVLYFYHHAPLEAFSTANMARFASLVSYATATAYATTPAATLATSGATLASEGKSN
jgi:hypothetical protein